MVKPLVKESAIERELLTRIKAAGGVAEKVTVLGARGFFDRLVLLPGGRVIFVEVKKPSGGRVSAHQMRDIPDTDCSAPRWRMIRDSADIDKLMSDA